MKKRRKACPTKRRPFARPEQGPPDAIVKSRSKPPEIYVRYEDERRPWRDKYKRAHLRNKAGYVYLCWREGSKVRTFYLGKAPRKSPTRYPDPDLAAGRGLERNRRAEKRP